MRNLLIASLLLPAILLANTQFHSVIARKNAGWTTISDHPTLTTNLVSYWNLNEASGTRVDSTATGNDLTDNNTVLSAAGKLGNAADFERDNSEYLSIADNASLSITGAVSISAWVNIESLNVMGIAGKYITAGNLRSYQMHIDAVDQQEGYVSSDGTAVYTKQITAVPSTATWYHMVMVFVPSTSLTMYRNGVALTQTAGGTIPASIQDNTSLFQIGAGWATGDNNFDGLIDEVGIWSKALSTDEIADLYGEGTPPAYEPWTTISDHPTLAAKVTTYYDFNEASGNRSDSVGSLTLTDNNTVASSTGVLSNAANFVAANSESLSRATNDVHTGTGAFTISGWVKASGTGTERFFSMGIDTPGGSMQQLSLENGVLWARQGVGNTASFGSGYQDGSWHHFVVTWPSSATSADINVYIDGSSVAAASTAGSDTINVLSDTFQFGANTVGTYATAEVDEVAIMSGSEVTASEVTDLYGGGTPPAY